MGFGDRVVGAGCGKPPQRPRRVSGGWHPLRFSPGESPGPTHPEAGQGRGQLAASGGPGLEACARRVAGLHLLRLRPYPGPRTPTGRSEGTSGPPRLDPQPGSLAPCAHAPPPSALAAPRGPRPAREDPLSQPPPGEPGRRRPPRRAPHPSPTTTHLMACMGAGREGAAARPSCGEMPGAAAAADRSRARSRAAGEAELPSVGRGDSRARGRQGGRGVRTG